jgi:putative membrane protein
MKDDFFTFLKGAAMGAANVIPGVSGGTIAFITGIYERLIDALRAFDIAALKLLSKGRIREVCEKVDLRFLIALGGGVAFSIITLAKVLEWAFGFHETLVWAFFFGLIAASLPAVAKLVKRWNAGAIVALVVGCAIAVGMAFLPPAAENTNPLYLTLCGVVAMSSMIIPGLSGSFVLLLMGNYQLIAIDTVNALSDGRFVEALKVIVPVGIGSVVGLIVLSRALSWLFKHYHDLAIALIAGFVAGSLLIIWPWKDFVPKVDAEGLIVVKTVERELVGREGTLTVVREGLQTDEEIMKRGYENWHLPVFSEKNTWLALVFVAAGAGLIVLMEALSRRRGE